MLTTRKSRILASCIGLVAVSVAWALPHPDASSRVNASKVPPTLVAKNAAFAQESSIDSVMRVLFEGISLTQEQVLRVREILVALDVRQRVQAALNQQGFQKTLALTTARDSVLRFLITNDQDRAVFEERITRRGGARGGGAGGVVFGSVVIPESLATRRSVEVQGAGGRGGNVGGGGRGGGGGGTGTNIVARGSGAGAGGGARGGGGGSGGFVSDSSLRVNASITFARGGGENTTSPEVIAANAEAQFQRLFSGISLSADQEIAAHAVILKTQQDMVGVQWQARLVAPRAQRKSPNGCGDDSVPCRFQSPFGAH